MNLTQLQEFKQQQYGKVLQRKEEEKRIRKGVYQMHAMVESQCMETFTKECEKNGGNTAGTRPEEKAAGTEKKENKKRDVQTEIEKMLAAGAKHAAMNQGIAQS